MRKIFVKNNVKYEKINTISDEWIFLLGWVKVDHVHPRIDHRSGVPKRSHNRSFRRIETPLVHSTHITQLAEHLVRDISLAHRLPSKCWVLGSTDQISLKVLMLQLICSEGWPARLWTWDCDRKLCCNDDSGTEPSLVSVQPWEQILHWIKLNLSPRVTVHFLSYWSHVILDQSRETYHDSFKDYCTILSTCLFTQLTSGNATTESNQPCIWSLSLIFCVWSLSLTTLYLINYLTSSRIFCRRSYCIVISASISVAILGLNTLII